MICRKPLNRFLGRRHDGPTPSGYVLGVADGEDLPGERGRAGPPLEVRRQDPGRRWREHNHPLGTALRSKGAEQTV